MRVHSGGRIRQHSCWMYSMWRCTVKMCLCFESTHLWPPRVPRHTEGAKNTVRHVTHSLPVYARLLPRWRPVGGEVWGVGRQNMASSWGGGGGGVGCCEHRPQGCRRWLISADDLDFLKFEQHFSGLRNVIKTQLLRFISPLSTK